MPRAKITTTSADSAVVEPFEIRSGNTTLLVFKPEIVQNSRDEEKAVRGKLVWQRRGASQRGEEWEDENRFKLTTMKAGRIAQSWRGWASLDGNEITGVIRFHLGDKSGFTAAKVKN